jgi:hypothetical protein
LNTVAFARRRQFLPAVVAQLLRGEEVNAQKHKQNSKYHSHLSKGK